MTPLLLSNVSQPKILQSTALSFHETVIKMGMMSRCYVLDNVANINVSNSVYDIKIWRTWGVPPRGPFTDVRQFDQRKISLTRAANSVIILDR